MSILFLAALALQPDATGVPRPVAPRLCTTEADQVATERLQIDVSTFRFSGRLTSTERRPGRHVPAAIITLSGNTPREEVSIYLAIRPATDRRYDVTQRRLVGGELRERQVLGHIPSGEAVDFGIEIAGDQVHFRAGELRSTVPLRGLRPNAIELSCGSGAFRFDDMAFLFTDQPVQQASAATAVEPSPVAGRPTRNRLICRTNPVLGSRLATRRVCMTAEQWAHHENALEQMRRDNQNRNPGVTSDE